MDISRMEREAQDRMLHHEPMDFKIIGPFGEQSAKWLDPYFGMFTIDGAGDGFFMVKQIANAYPPLDFVWADAS